MAILMEKGTGIKQIYYRKANDNCYQNFLDQLIYQKCIKKVLEGEILKIDLVHAFYDVHTLGHYIMRRLRILRSW